MNNMTKTLCTRLAMLLLAVFGQVTVASAADGDITIDDIILPVGVETTVEVKLTSDELMINPQFDVTLPANVTFVEDSEAKGELLSKAYSMACVEQDDGSYRFVFTSLNVALKGTEGVLATFKVQALSTFTNATMTVSNKAMQTKALYNGKHTGVTPAATVSNVTATLAMDGEVTTSVSPTEFSVEVGKQFTANFDMQNTASVVSLQADLTLPAGIKLVETEDGNIGYTDRIPESATIGAVEKNGVYKIVMTNINNEVIEGEEGTLFYLNLIADETFAAEGGNITIDNIVVACQNGAGATLEDNFDIALTNATAEAAAKAEAEAKAAAEEAVATLKEAAAELKVSEEAKAYEAENVQAAVAEAEAAIQAANDAIAAVEAIIAEGKLATDNKEALAEAIAAAEQAILDAAAAIDEAEQVYVEQKEADEKAEELKKNKETFNAYKESKKLEASAQASEDDSDDIKEKVAELIEAAKTALDELEYDESLTLDGNMLAADGIIAQLLKDLAAIRPVLGDITGTGEVTTDDVVAYIDVLLGKEGAITTADLWNINAYDTPEQYAENKKFDVNGDGYFDVADIQAVLNISLGLNPDGSVPSNARAFNDGQASAKLVASNVNGMTRYTVKYEGKDYTAFQMNVKAENGMRIVSCQAEGATLNTNTMTDGSMRIIGFVNGGNMNEMLTIDVMGEGTLTVSNARISDADAIATALAIGETTGISTVKDAEATANSTYDLSGKQLNGYNKGVNIVRKADGSVVKVMVK